MMTYRLFPSRNLLAVVLILLFASACSSLPAETPFIPPTQPAPLIEPTFIIQPTKQVIVQPSLIPTIEIASTLTPTRSPADCTNNLTFITDATVPDNSIYNQGEIIDKQWLIENSGTCNWDSNYRLRHTNGNVLGAPEEIALYPARAGTQVTIRIVFTAPLSADFYVSEWQAIAPDGTPFGDPIYVKVNIQ
jgi:hypothetical protein